MHLMHLDVQSFPVVGRRLPIGRLLQLIQGFLLAKGDSFFVAGDLGKFQAQSLAFSFKFANNGGKSN